MLETLRELRDKGYPQEFLNRYAEYRQRYAHMPLQERVMMDFGYYLRMRYIEYLRRDGVR